MYVYIRNSMETTCSKNILNLIKIYGIEVFILKYNNSLSRICLVRTGFSGGSDSKDAMQETRVRSLEKGMAPHSSVFAWKIPWTEEPGRL